MPSTSDQVFPSSFPPPGLTADTLAALQQHQQSSQLPQLQQQNGALPSVDATVGNISALQQLLTLSSRLQQLRGQPAPPQTFHQLSQQLQLGAATDATAASAAPQNLAFESEFQYTDSLSRPVMLLAVKTRPALKVVRILL